MFEFEKIHQKILKHEMKLIINVGTTKIAKHRKNV